ncbi:sigma-70 family RNA polymerase sigma factor [Microbacterium schleiferi]|uniref:Sigma-70 family RNA polymerase sigma factor n=1 Tax=Microbacterium schleiferi TaxID=69362 RepID=A0A7S8MXK3_9MICO|nr:sigma-70 family RNA polymerase sigma factor [Microbacterium schleiferi]QPE05030.1 sigma-70 family RNA polymerase sigma factor [Microbacterium schleiferi]
MPRTGLSALSDDELVTLSRRDTSAAYAELWLRHSSAALAVARAFTTLDADDVVSEAFTRVFARIRSGGGPTMGFRAYLLTAVKNVAREWGARAGDLSTADVAELPADTDTARAAEAALESGATVSAFRSLPTRWQEALWYSDVEGLKPRQFAPLLGLAANAASALVVRARRGFRDAWVSAQLRTADNDECRGVLSMLGTHTRGGLSARDTRTAQAHLATCERCAVAWEEAQHVSSRLALALLPVVVGARL